MGYFTLFLQKWQVFLFDYLKLAGFGCYFLTFMCEVREQEIYEEMELTPEMVKSIRTLCGTCLRHFVDAKAFKIALVPSPDRSMDTCTVCQMRRGYDYVVMHR